MIAGRKSRKELIPFGPFLALGGVTAVFWARPLVDWYLRLRGFWTGGPAMPFSTITASFSAAHALRNCQGKWERLHGHNWKIEVLTAAGTLDQSGMGLDFTVLRERLGAVLAALRIDLLEAFAVLLDEAVERGLPGRRGR